MPYLEQQFSNVSTVRFVYMMLLDATFLIRLILLSVNFWCLNRLPQSVSCSSDLKVRIPQL